MKYLKLFENYELTEEIEDFVIDLIDSGMVEKGEDGREFQEIKLVKKTSGGAWVPTHYSVKFKLKIKTVLTSLEDVQFNRNLYDKIYQIVYRFGSDFKVSSNELTFFVECADSIKNFFTRWGSGKEFIDFEPEPPLYIGTYISKMMEPRPKHTRIVSPCSVERIEDDFSVVFSTRLLNGGPLKEGLDFVKGLVEGETEYKYNVEIWGEDPANRRNIYIRVKP